MDQKLKELAWVQLAVKNCSSRPYGAVPVKELCVEVSKYVDEIEIEFDRKFNPPREIHIPDVSASDLGL